MSEQCLWQPSPLLLSTTQSCLAVIDMQERLLPSIDQKDVVLKNVCFLMDVAKILQVRTIVTEQYPRGLGPTVPEILNHEAVGLRLEKVRFSAAEVLSHAGELEPPDSSRVRQVVLAGIETHICIQQTALDLLAQRCRVFLAADATGSRNPSDRDVAFQRLRDAGVIVTTAEAIAFEWCRKAGSEEFRSLSKLVKARDFKKIPE